MIPVYALRRPSARMTIPIVLADPHPVARTALGTLLAEDGDLEVIGTGDLEEGLRAVARRHAPILIVSRRLLERGPAGMRLPAPLPAGTQTIVIGLESDQAFVRDARRAGAAAYVVKDRADRELRAQVDALLHPTDPTANWRLSA
jgi:DNA-binding NarL/FixJ family response regulator